MDKAVHERIVSLREEGLSYNRISEELNIPVSTIKSLFSKLRKEAADRNGSPIRRERTCPVCGGSFLCGRSDRVYCSDRCRNAYFNHHRTMREAYTKVKNCPTCRRAFRFYPSSGRQYCSKECSLIGRFGKKTEVKGLK